MTAEERLALIQPKIERAKHHIVDLHRQFRVFIDTKPYRVSTQRDPQTSKLIYYASRVEPMPTAFATITGDAIQNLRSALDHLAYQLHLVGTNLTADPKWGGRFLCERSAHEFKSRIHGVVKGMRQDAVDAIHAIEPYKGGKGEAFWILNELNNADKHRLIVTVASVFHRTVVPVHVHIDPALIAEGVRIWDSQLLITPRDAPRSLKQGDILFVDGPNAKLNKEYQFMVGVAISEPGIVEGKPLLETLQHLADLVSNTALLFKPCLA
jgi:hypothetical protein